MTEKTKPALHSRTLIGAGLVIVSTIAQQAGYDIPVPALETTVTTVVDLLGAGLAIWGRLRADTPIAGLVRS